MSDVLVSAKGIHKTYTLGQRSLEVLRGVDLELRRGEFLALRGASGAGKSTLLHLLGGLDSPSQGEIWLAGRNLATLGPGRPGAAAQQRGGLHFPGLLPVAGTGCAGKRLPARAHGPHPGGASRGPRPRFAGARGPQGARRAQALRAFRRRTAARRHRAGADQRARSHPGRRADRQPGLAHGGGDHRTCSARCATRSKPR